MAEPISLDVPHSLGKATVRQRLDTGIGKIGSIIPGGGQVQHDWDGDTMNFSVSALGQTMACKAVIFEDKVHAEVDLPPMLSLFAGKIRDALGHELPKLLR
ncbi:MAG: polyhydroxyalkanoic acid system family protein [Sphingomonadales bacterium]